MPNWVLLSLHLLSQSLYGSTNLGVFDSLKECYNEMHRHLDEKVLVCVEIK